MVDFNNKIEESMNNFSNAEFNDTVSILEWFYNMRNYKVIYEDETMSDLLYRKLYSLGYKEIDNNIEEAICIKRLLKKEEDSSQERIGETLISLIMKSLKEHKVLQTSIIQFIEIYNETYNKERTYEKMMSLLNESIGLDVVFIAIINNELKLLTGKLEEVDNYNSVTISGVNYPFIGNNIAINKITSCEGTLLFNNSNISKEEDLSNNSVVEKSKEKLFGTRKTTPML